MERTSASAKERIDALDTECYAIADELSRATMLLRDEGLPIEKVLVNRIASLDKDIRDACEELRAWATELGVADLPDPFTTSVRCARQMLQQIAITEVDVKRERDAALAILEQVLAIRTIDQTAFAPLETCQDAARQLRADILDVQPPALHLDAAALVAGTHPFAALLALFDPHALDNTAYDRYLEQVETSFERSLRGALFRNQLTLHAATTAPDSYASVQREEPGNGDTTPAGSSADTPLAGAAADIPEITPQAELLLEEAAEPGATPPIIDSATSETLVVQATPQPLDTLSAAPEPEPGKYENGRWLAAETTFIPNLVLSDIPETAFDIKLSQARQLAKELIAIAPEERAASLADLIFLLLAEQRSAEAYQISRVCEQVYAEQNTALPEWFVRALALGVHLQGSYTAIANTLQDDMVTFNTDLFQQGDEQMQRALTLLGVGALLPIAMLAPETGAAELLLYLPARNLPKAINRVRQAIGEFFKTHSAIDANTMRFLRDNSVWEQEWQDILTDTQDYWDDAENKRLVYAPASEVWWPSRVLNAIGHGMVELDQTRWLRVSNDPTDPGR